MTWYQVDITESCVLGGEYHRLCRQFQREFIGAGAPPDMALFAETIPLSDTRKVYFSPGSLPYVQSLIEAFGGQTCSCPNGTDVTLVYGVPDADLSLLDTARAA